MSTTPRSITRLPYSLKKFVRDLPTDNRRKLREVLGGRFKYAASSVSLPKE